MEAAAPLWKYPHCLTNESIHKVHNWQKNGGGKNIIGLHKHELFPMNDLNDLN